MTLLSLPWYIVMKFWLECFSNLAVMLTPIISFFLKDKLIAWYRRYSIEHTPQQQVTVNSTQFSLVDFTNISVGEVLYINQFGIMYKDKSTIRNWYDNDGKNRQLFLYNDIETIATVMQKNVDYVLLQIKLTNGMEVTSKFFKQEMNVLTKAKKENR